jgi:membrane associated rhomboid family serine protease
MFNKLFIGFIFNIIFIINYFFISYFKINVNNKILKYDQIIGSPEENTIYRSFISSHIHTNFLHLIQNCICLNIISYLLVDITFWYIPVIIFYFTLFTDHFIIELIKFKRSRVIGSSGCILGLYGFYLSNILIKLFNQSIKLNNIHLFSIFIIIIIFFQLIYKFYKEILKETDNISDTSHIIGFIIGLIYGILFNLI